MFFLKGVWEQEGLIECLTHHLKGARVKQNEIPVHELALYHY